MNKMDRKKAKGKEKDVLLPVFSLSFPVGSVAFLGKPATSWAGCVCDGPGIPKASFNSGDFTRTAQESYRAVKEYADRIWCTEPVAGREEGGR